MNELPTDDPRIQDITDLIYQFAAGNLSARTSPSTNGDKLDAIIGGLNMLAQELAASHQLLKKGENKYRTLIETMNDGLGIQNEKGIITYVNPRFCEIFGYPEDEILGQPVISFLSEQSKDDFLEAMKKRQLGVSSTLKLDWIKKDGTISHTISSGKSITDKDGKFAGSFAVITDISQQKTLEKKLILSQRMEALGTLAGGIAHDFNNILGSILGFGHLLQSKLPKESAEFDYANEIMISGTRATNLVKQILTFVSKNDLNFNNYELTSIVKEFIPLLRSTIPTNIKIEAEYTKYEGIISADKSLIEQVLYNICTNAAQSIGPAQGIIEINVNHTSKMSILNPYNGENIDGNFLHLSIADTGAPIQEEVADKIFEPFFTTKAKGEGTGLGLSVVHGIIKQHNGHIFFENRSNNQGKIFHLFFPCLQEKAYDSTQQEVKNRPFKKSGHILIVDDEKSLLKMYGILLSDKGYKVTCFADGLKALAEFEQNNTIYDVVLLDYTMPCILGDLSKRLLKVNPEIPIILTTGYNNYIAPEKAKSIGITEFILKPIDADNLFRIIEKLLEKR